MSSVDSLIQYAIDSSNHFQSEKEELDHLRKTKPILRDELLTCYQYLQEKGLLEEFKEYRGSASINIGQSFCN